MMKRLLFVLLTLFVALSIGILTTHAQGNSRQWCDGGRVKCLFGECYRVYEVG